MNKGSKHTEEAKEKNRQAHLGRTPWSKGLKGVLKSHRKGLSMVDEYGEEKAKLIKQRLREANIGKKHSKESIEKFKKTMKFRKSLGIIHLGFQKGFKHTEEWKKNHSKLMTGRKYSWGHKISTSLRKKTWEERVGKEKAQQIRELQRKNNLGKKLSNEHRKKMSLNNAKYWKDKNLSEETKRKLSISQSGKKLSENTKIKISNSKQGHYVSKETKDKIRIANSGKIRTEETKKKLSEINKGRLLGQKNPNWQGGISFEPYTLDFNVKFKEMIKERDNYSCQLCGMFEDDYIKLHKRKLTIHHIDYDKKNTFPQNCCTLCLKCNNIVNKDREIWTKHFQELLKKLYGYEYTPDQKIILDFIVGDKN